MTINENMTYLPGLWGEKPTEDDLKIFELLTDEEIDELSLLTESECRSLEIKAKKYKISKIALWWSWMDNDELEEMKELFLPVTDVYRHLGIEVSDNEIIDALIVSHALFAIAGTREKERVRELLKGRTSLELTILCFETSTGISDERDFEFWTNANFLKIGIFLFFESLTIIHEEKAIHYLMGHLRLNPNFWIVLICYIFSEAKQMKYEPRKAWWYIPYRVLYDRQVLFSLSKVSFMAFIATMKPTWEYCAKVFDIEELVVDWNFDEDEDGVIKVNKTAFGRGGSENHPGYGDYAWKGWIDSFRESRYKNDPKVHERLFGSDTLCFDMHAIAMRLDELLNYVLGPSPQA